MPRIKAYTASDLLIPVADAAIVTVYQCPWTFKLFKRKADYIKHLKSLRETRMHRKARFISRNRRLKELWNLPSFDDVIYWLDSNPRMTLDNMYQNTKVNPNQFRFRITYLDLTWSQNVSNSHDCPHNGVTNWSKRDCFPDGTPKPTGYPGWSGRIEFQTSHNTGVGGDLLKNFRIHTGTGGGIGMNRYGYSVTLFDADWPGIRTYLSLLDQKPNSYMYGKPVYFK